MLRIALKNTTSVVELVENYNIINPIKIILEFPLDAALWTRFLENVTLFSRIKKLD